MIPWIIALALLFGTSAFAPDRAQVESQTSSEEATFRQAADQAHLPGRSSTPLVKIPAITWGFCGLPEPVSCLVRVGAASEHRLRQSKRGVAQGRAPPASAVA
jgi:hypothetical protein